MAFSDEELLPISALQHYVFCSRQCALIHIEQVWDENVFTAEGRILHERVHEHKPELRGKVRYEYGVPLRSLELGLVGMADLLEFHRSDINGKEIWLPYPVEYKRGRPKKDDCDRIQLCAQAMCLEEMLGLSISEGALFYGQTHHRTGVIFDLALRARVVAVSQELREFLKGGRTPAAEYDEKCKSCSIEKLCMPKILMKPGKVKKYLNSVLVDDEETS